MLDEITRDRQSKPSTLETKKDKKIVDNVNNKDNEAVIGDQAQEHENAASNDNTESNETNSQIEDNNSAPQQT